ncbi:MAG: glycogen synthase GlgA [Desulfuromusa sp.]|nr:glycogen synthase GlgA [Desulfuromusa sp.]
MKVLFASSEIYPLVKTGGLADVSAGLPAALQTLGQEIMLIMPAYTDALAVAGEVQEVATMQVSGCGQQRSVRLLRGILDRIGCSLLLVEIEGLFDRPGNPYQTLSGEDWPDNGERFALFSQVVADVALDRFNLHWQPEIVHCNDWQTGLVPALLSREDPNQRPGTVFTIHNLSYGGHFPYLLFEELGLPPEWWHFTRIEFYGSMSMLKAGIVFADYVTTVSPSYADEICTEEHGFGLHAVLQQRQKQGRLQGILNGIDTQIWNPQHDPYLPFHYSAQRGRVARRKQNKLALLQLLDKEHATALLSAPLIGFIGRLIEQKGIDLIIQALPELMKSTNASFVIVGTGIHLFERQLTALARQFSRRIFVRIDYSEKLAHLIEGGADMFLMPSRFEPCGLNQMYSLIYGTLPIVHATGGLKDTVIDTNKTTLENGTATGFVFDSLTPATLCYTVQRALLQYQRPRRWQAMQKTAMLQDFSWQNSAQTYLNLYHQASPQGVLYACTTT